MVINVVIECIFVVLSDTISDAEKFPLFLTLFLARPIGVAGEELKSANGGLDFGICCARAHQDERALGEGGVDQKCRACQGQPVVDVVEPKEWR